MTTFSSEAPMGFFSKRLEVRLTNVAGFPTDVPVGLVLVMSDGKQWRVTKRVSNTVLVLVPLRWWHHRYWPLFIGWAVGVGAGFAAQWWLR